MDNPDDKFFQVSVKGLFFDEKGKLMMLQEPDGRWEVVGGRVEKGEDLIDCLKRECREEIGLECEVLAQHPSIAYSTIDQDGVPRIMLFYKIKLGSLDFKHSDECINMKFYSKKEIEKLNKVSQLAKFSDYL